MYMFHPVQIVNYLRIWNIFRKLVLYYSVATKSNGTLLNQELKDQLEDAALSSSKAMNQVRRSNSEDGEGGQVASTVSIDGMILDKSKEKEEASKKISQEIAVMQPILRFQQLLCENHNRDLQVG